MIRFQMNISLYYLITLLKNIMVNLIPVNNFIHMAPQHNMKILFIDYVLKNNNIKIVLVSYILQLFLLGKGSRMKVISSKPKVF